MVDKVLVPLYLSGHGGAGIADLPADALFAQIRSFNARGVTNLNLDGARLVGCGFADLDLQFASFTGSSLREVDFAEANIAGVWLDAAQLESVSMVEQRVKAASFQGSRLAVTSCPQG